MFIQPIKKELQHRKSRRRLQVEGAIDETEMPRTAIVQHSQLRKQRGHIKGHRSLVERGETELAAKRAAARGFDIEKPIAQVLVGVERIRRRDLRQIGRAAVDDASSGPVARKHAPAQVREREVRLPCDDVIGQRADSLPVDLETHLRPADHDAHLGRYALQHRHRACGFLHVPDVHAEANDQGRVGKQRLDQIRSARAKHELANPRARRQLAEIGVQIAQPERGVHMACVERGEDDIRHTASVERPALAWLVRSMPKTYRTRPDRANPPNLVLREA